VCRFYSLLTFAAGKVDTFLHNLLRLDSKIVKVHKLFLLSYRWVGQKKCQMENYDKMAG
jgi:hypothetical protein